MADGTFDNLTATSAEIGRSGAAGHVRLRNAAGTTTVHLDGEAGDVVLHNADCAEEFDVSRLEGGPVEAGAVVVLDDDGSVRRCDRAYDRRVAGVVSGAGPFRPAIVLHRVDTGRDRVPIGLIGKVACLADATEEPISVGDLLTTSDRPGHARRASDPARAFGAVLGKALAPLPEGTGTIPILVALQ